MAECKRRALELGRGQTDPLPASAFASTIWPDAEFITQQGAGAAASRVLKALERDGRAWWSRRGWIVQ